MLHYNTSINISRRVNSTPQNDPTSKIQSRVSTSYHYYILCDFYLFFIYLISLYPFSVPMTPCLRPPVSLPLVSTCYLSRFVSLQTLASEIDPRMENFVSKRTTFVWGAGKGGRSSRNALQRGTRTATTSQRNGTRRLQG